MLASFILRRTRSAWLLAGCLAATVLVASALVGALVTFSTTALTRAVDSELSQAGPAMSIAVSGELSGTPAAQAAGLAARMTRALGPVPYRMYQATWSDALAVAGPERAGQVPVMSVAAIGGIGAHAALTSGSWPGAPRPGRPIPAALPATAAAALRLRLGSVFIVRDLGTGAQATLQVSGLYRPKLPTAAYWQIDLVGITGVTISGGFASYGPAVVSPAVFGPAAGHRPLIAATQASFVVLPRVASITPAELTPLATRIRAMTSAISSAGQLTGTSAMSSALASAAAGQAAAKTLVVISGLQLVLLAAAALALASRLLAAGREWETALLAARGAARRQLIAPSLAEAAGSVAVSAAAGVLIGSWLSAALLDRLTGQSWHLTVPGAAVWTAGGALAVLCAGIAIWPAARPSRLPEVAVRRGRSAQLATLVTAGADVAVVVLAVLAVRELRSYSVAAQVASGTGIDPVIAVAPTLALAGLAVVPLRLLPVAARGMERLTARGRRLGSALANWEISRRPLRQSGPALLMMLAVGATTIALAQYQSWRDSVRDQAEFAAGAQVRVDALQPEPVADDSRIARLPGVRVAMPVSDVPLLTAGQLLVLDAPLAARTVTLRPDLASVPVPQLFRAITPRSPAGMLLPGRPVRLEVAASMAGPTGMAALGPVSVTLTLQDADGVGYSVGTSVMPADGRTHELVALLGRPGGAAYPLRLIGVSVSYQMPPYPPPSSASISAGPASLRLGSISASPAATGPFEPPLAAGAALAAWPLTLADPGLAGQIAQLGGAADGSAAPRVDTSGRAGSAAAVSFEPGHGPLVPGAASSGAAGSGPGLAELNFDIPAPPPVPVIATAGYAAAGGLRLGSVFPVTIAGQQVPCRLAGTVAAFPAGGVLVADQATVQDALASRGFGGALPVTAWWLATVHGAVPRGLPAGTAVTDAAELDRRLSRDPVSAAPAEAAAAAGAAAAALAALGCCVSVAASARERRPQQALLSALGVRRGTQTWLFCLEEALVSLPAAAVGLAIGTVLAHLLVPALTVTATGGLPSLPVIVTLPAGWLAVITAGLPAVAVLAAAVAGSVTAAAQPTVW